LATGSPWDVPKPVLFNTWKHHAAALRHRIGEVVRGGEAALESLADELIVIGAKLMDLYTGSYSPAEVGRLVREQLGRDGRLELEAFRDWVRAEGGYRMLTLPDDSAWVLRLGEEDDRYVHVHPGRWVPHTTLSMRVPRTALTEALRRCLEFLPIEATISSAAVVDHKRDIRVPLP